ncbi:25 kDa ookinete surface antigen-like [Dreissena polymorpha]|uniref:25 kDa ookinete surface antigen-like n=1 Tax=Dreissena polymorpha TaxID=45954 RepID=UPI0022653F3B|nr:25 kDa ookinete surface antigen-like [Dreissena polymorpha]
MDSSVCADVFMLISLSFLFSSTDGLICYSCDATFGTTQPVANIDCLAVGLNITCPTNQNRCFSKHAIMETGAVVDKGCTQSDQCLGTTLCCNADFCNSDLPRTVTGYGRTCTDAQGCVQGGREMICVPEAPGSRIRRCLCAEDSYQKGSICKRKSFPGLPCELTRHCLDVNSTCISDVCTCNEGMFTDVNKCSRKMGLGFPCNVSEGCLGENTACTAGACACEFGFIAINGTDSCSGFETYHGSWDLRLCAAVLYAILMRWSIYQS